MYKHKYEKIRLFLSVKLYETKVRPQIFRLQLKRISSRTRERCLPSGRLVWHTARLVTVQMGRFLKYFL